jgi:hypothetical protein
MTTDPKDRKTRDLLSGVEQGPFSAPLWLRPTKVKLTDKGREVSFTDPEDEHQAERLRRQQRKEHN